MNVTELLAELDTYLLARTTLELKRTISANVGFYQCRGVYQRLNNIVEEHDIGIIVYDYGGPGETAYHTGDVINSFWMRKVEDYIQITNAWSGRILRARKPVAICRVIVDPAVGEKWIHLLETDSDWGTTPPTITDTTVIEYNP